jgi:hypothetical protein
MILAHLTDSLHNTPGAYWCPACHAFTLECNHLVEPLDAPRIALKNWLIESVAYDRKRQILELEMNTLERFQFYNVPRYLAVGLVKAEDPAAFDREFISGKFRFARVRTIR